MLKLISGEKLVFVISFPLQHAPRVHCAAAAMNNDLLPADLGLAIHFPPPSTPLVHHTNNIVEFAIQQHEQQPQQVEQPFEQQQQQFEQQQQQQPQQQFEQQQQPQQHEQQPQQEQFEQQFEQPQQQHQQFEQLQQQPFEQPSQQQYIHHLEAVNNKLRDEIATRNTLLTEVSQLVQEMKQRVTPDKERTTAFIAQHLQQLQPNALLRTLPNALGALALADEFIAFLEGDIQEKQQQQQQAHNTKLQQQQQEHDTRLQRQQQAHDTKLQQQQQAHDTKLQQQQQAHNTELQQLKKAHDAERQQLKEAHEAELQQFQTRACDLEQQVNAATEEHRWLMEAHTRHLEEILTLKDQLQQRQDDVSTLQDQLRQLQQHKEKPVSAPSTTVPVSPATTTTQPADVPTLEQQTKKAQPPAAAKSSKPKQSKSQVTASTTKTASAQPTTAPVAAASATIQTVKTHATTHDGSSAKRMKTATNVAPMYISVAADETAAADEAAATTVANQSAVDSGQTLVGKFEKYIFIHMHEGVFKAFDKLGVAKECGCVFMKGNHSALTTRVKYMKPNSIIIHSFSSKKNLQSLPGIENHQLVSECSFAPFIGSDPSTSKIDAFIEYCSTLLRQ